MRLDFRQILSGDGQVLCPRNPIAKAVRTPLYKMRVVENKRKKPELVQKMLAEDGEVKEGKSEGGVRYLSVLNARRNPDLIVSGGKFLKGN